MPARPRVPALTWRSPNCSTRQDTASSSTSARPKARTSSPGWTASGPTTKPCGTPGRRWRWRRTGWDEVASRCLTCGNCTLACPTCFCTTVEDTTDLTGEHAERWERWDSCFDLDFSYLHRSEERRVGGRRERRCGL